MDFIFYVHYSMVLCMYVPVVGVEIFTPKMGHCGHVGVSQTIEVTSDHLGGVGRQCHIVSSLHCLVEEEGSHHSGTAHSFH